jgi:hypothetical protein
MADVVAAADVESLGPSGLLRPHYNTAITGHAARLTKTALVGAKPFNLQPTFLISLGLRFRCPMSPVKTVEKQGSRFQYSSRVSCQRITRTR